MLGGFGLSWRTVHTLTPVLTSLPRPPLVRQWLVNHFTAKGGQIRAKLEKNPTKFQMPLYWPRPWQLYLLLYEWNLQIKSHIPCNILSMLSTWFNAAFLICNILGKPRVSPCLLARPFFLVPTKSKRLPRRQWNIIVCKQPLTFVWTEYSPYLT